MKIKRDLENVITEIDDAANIDYAIFKANYETEGGGLTFEDYCIFVHIVGHANYNKYLTAHFRDSDIMDKTDVWKALQNTTESFQKAVSL